MADTNETSQPQPFAHATAELFNNPQFSDACVRSRGREWYIHRCIVCPRSAYFSRAFEAGFEETKGKCITLDHDDADAVDAALQFLYKGNYQEWRVGTETNHMITHIRVYAFADKILLDKLAKVAIEKLKDALMVEQGRPKWVHAIALAYAIDLLPEQASVLRKAVIDTVVPHASKLLAEDPRFAEFRAMALETPAFSLDLAMALAAKDNHRIPYGAGFHHTQHPYAGYNPYYYPVPGAMALPYPMGGSMATNTFHNLSSAPNTSASTSTSTPESDLVDEGSETYEMAVLEY